MKSSAGAIFVDETTKGGDATEVEEVLTASRCLRGRQRACANTQATQRRRKASARADNSGKRQPDFQVVENAGGIVTLGAAQEKARRWAGLSSGLQMNF
jgi:hypothetical protein